MGPSRQISPDRARIDSAPILTPTGLPPHTWPSSLLYYIQHMMFGLVKTRFSPCEDAAKHSSSSSQCDLPGSMDHEEPKDDPQTPAHLSLDELPTIEDQFDSTRSHQPSPSPFRDVHDVACFPISAESSIPSFQSPLPVSDPREIDTRRICSNRPLIVCSDSPTHGNPFFLCLPPGSMETVFVDDLESVQRMKGRSVWNDELSSPSLPPVYCLENGGGRASRVLAQRAIKAGELIVSERPLFASRRRYTRPTSVAKANEIFQKAATVCLPPDSIAAKTALNNTYGKEFDIVPFYSNSTDVAESSDPSYSFVGYFATISHVGHDCSPSANYYFSSKSYSGQLWATRDISQGEAITIGYVEICANHDDRQDDLLDFYNIRCACKVCSLPSRLLKTSDARREALGEFSRLIDTSFFPATMTKDRVSRMLEWAGQEELTVASARILLYGCNLLALQKDFAAAKEWAKMARKAFRVVDGPASDNVKRLRTLSRFLDMCQVEELISRDKVM